MPQGKLEHLRSILRETGGALVAFSSGADSTFLLRVAHDTLGDRAVAATVRSAALPAHESEEAARFCRDLGIRHEFVDIDIAGMPGFAENGPDRCYLCKKELFIRLAELATRLGLAVVTEGSNTDDEADFRPGLRAIAELGVRSPLREAGFTKPEIRALSREMGLPTWDKAASACLASRFPYGETITRAGLERVERAERF